MKKPRGWGGKVGNKEGWFGKITLYLSLQTYKKRRR